MRSLTLLLATALACSGASAFEPVSFNEQILPILSDRCFSCHGPDSAARKGGMRLDLEEAAKSALENGVIPIVPGKPAASAIMQRILSKDPDEIMPPPESKVSLSSDEAALIGAWISQGAAWEKHWAFLPPRKIPANSPADHPWPRNIIDEHLLTRLSKEELSPSAPAAPAHLLRRLSFDLTGLPPTIPELNSFLSDNSAEGYEKAADRLLASPAFGERLAQEWLDVARYGDTDGLFEDHPRTIWAWRDWVVTAFNDNLPYDQFITWQLAGDLLPQPTRDQRIATGFLRNNPTSNEGGLIDEDYRIKYLVDRVNTTSTAFLGLTMECAQCHDHKFDPMTQREYYEFAGFFNSLEGRGNTKGATSPTLRILPPGKEKRLEIVHQRLATLEEELKSTPDALTEGFEKWLGQIEKPVNWLSPRVLSDSRHSTSTKTPETPHEESPVRGQFIRIALKPGATSFLTISEVQVYSGASNVAPTGSARQSSTGYNAPASKAIDGKADGSFASCSCTNEEQDAWWELNLGRELPIDQILVFNRNDCCPERLNNVSITVLDPKRRETWSSRIETAPFRSSFVQNPNAPTPVTQAPASYELILEPKATEQKITALQISSASTGTIPSIKAEILGEKPRPLKLDHAEKISLNPETPHLVTLPSPAALGTSEKLKLTIEGEVGISVQVTTDSSVVQRAKLPKDRNKRLEHFRNSWPGFSAQRSERDSLQKEKTLIEKSAVITMVAGEQARIRPTHILMRGEYDKPGEQVQPAAPGSIMDFSEELPKNRLGLAQWMTDPSNPLTARVAVNRYWQLLFGAGLVTTSEDFGTQGNRPSHQGLLDYLAVDFMESGWDLKRLIRLMVTSATYRQASHRTADLVEHDPDNRLLARMTRQRLPAEFIRDHALFVSGLLVNKMGGPGVNPYQPSVLFGRNAIGAAGASFKQGSGDDLYRRSLYTYWKRQIPAANMRILGADGRTACRTRREGTNTPLQALVLLNDPQFAEAARVLGERIMKEGGDTPEKRLSFAFRLATSRTPTKAELTILLAEYSDRLQEFQDTPERARDYLAGIGHRKADPALDPAQLAAFTATCSLILNLDEAISKS